MVFDKILNVFQAHIPEIINVSNFGPKLRNLMELLVLLVHQHLVKV
jgi:hypothetical protein